MVAGAATECHLQHVDLEVAANMPGMDVDRGLREIGEFLSNIREINELELLIASDGPNDARNLSLAALNMGLVEKYESLPSPEQLDLIPLNCPPSFFLEVLTGYIRDAIISLQSWTRKDDNVKKNILIKRINTLRDDFLINSAVISELEAELNGIVKSELNLKIKNMKIFENLSTEKPTGLFLSLAKNKMSGTGLGKIKNDNDTPFDNDDMRNEYITSFYENLYEKDPAEPQNFDNIIEDFLGP